MNDGIPKVFLKDGSVPFSVSFFLRLAFLLKAGAVAVILGQIVGVHTPEMSKQNVRKNLSS